MGMDAVMVSGLLNLMTSFVTGTIHTRYYKVFSERGKGEEL